jgi:hypothetical protein
MRVVDSDRQLTNHSLGMVLTASQFVAALFSPLAVTSSINDERSKTRNDKTGADSINAVALPKIRLCFAFSG